MNLAIAAANDMEVRLGTSPGFPQVLMSILMGILVGHVTRRSGSPVYMGL